MIADDTAHRHRRSQDDADGRSAVSHAVCGGSSTASSRRAPPRVCGHASKCCAARSSTTSIERGECDFVTDVAGELPSYVVAELMGIPLDDGRRLYQLTETIHAAPESVRARRRDERGARDVQLRARRRRRTSARTRPTTSPRRSCTPRSTATASTTSISTCSSCCSSTRAATRRATSSAAACSRCSSTPTRCHDCSGDLDSLVGSADRGDAALGQPGHPDAQNRDACADICTTSTIAEGDKVVMYYGAANRDPHAFDEPERFDISTGTERARRVRRRRAALLPRRAHRTRSRSTRCCARP